MENTDQDPARLPKKESPYYNDGRLVVLNVWTWTHQETNLSLGGIIGQVTHCKYNEIPFYVRENLTGIPSFYISAGERWGDKVGTGKPRSERQVLELLAHPSDWKRLAEVVRQYDSSNRPVRWNPRFNAAFIKKLQLPEIDKLDAWRQPRSYKQQKGRRPP